MSPRVPGRLVCEVAECAGALMGASEWCLCVRTPRGPQTKADLAPSPWASGLF